jgi:hypothetical protein
VLNILAVQADTNSCLPTPMEVDASTEPAQPHAEDHAMSQLLSSVPEAAACAPAGRPLARKVTLSRRSPNNANCILDPASSRRMVLRPSPPKRSRQHLSSSGFCEGEDDDVPLPARGKRRANNNPGEQVGANCLHSVRTLVPPSTCDCHTAV